jgi:hypothetical protein
VRQKRKIKLKSNRFIQAKLAVSTLPHPDEDVEVIIVPQCHGKHDAVATPHHHSFGDNAPGKHHG